MEQPERNSAIRFACVPALALAAIAILFPPWIVFFEARSHGEHIGYHFLLSPPVPEYAGHLSRINGEVLFLELAFVAIVAAMVVLVLKGTHK